MAIADIEDVDLEVLRPHVLDVFFTKITMQNRKILYGAWKDVVGAESAIPKSNVLGGRFIATAPLTLDGRLAAHVMG